MYLLTLKSPAGVKRSENTGQIDLKVRQSCKIHHKSLITINENNALMKTEINQRHHP